MILNRSPFHYNVVYPNVYVTSIDFEIIVGTGSTTTVVPVETYTASQPNPSSSTTNTWIDLSPFIRDLYTFTPLDFTGVSVAEMRTSGANSVLMVEVTASTIDSIGSNEDDVSNKYICTDGYGYYTDGQNYQPSQKILLSHTTYKADARGYFIVPLRAASGDGNPTVNAVEVALSFTDNNQNYVKYLVVPLSAYSGTVAVVFEGETINIEIIDECKYPVNEIQFINRFGVFEAVHFYKAKKETVNVKGETFKNTYTNGVSYDVQKHQYQKFNVVANKTIRIETGFLNEDYNATIQELISSEHVWIDGNPVNIRSNSLELKTRIVDKLISYSIDFDYAYDEISNV